jgi:hypothetical protein
LILYPAVLDTIFPLNFASRVFQQYRADAAARALLRK